MKRSLFLFLARMVARYWANRYRHGGITRGERSVRGLYRWSYPGWLVVGYVNPDGSKHYFQRGYDIIWYSAPRSPL